MSRALLACLVVAACAAPKPSPPKPASNVDELIALIEAGGDRACACGDRGCTEAVEADLATAIAASKVPPRWIEEKPARDRAVAAEWKAIRCLQAHDTTAYGFAPLSASYFADLRASFCVCKDDTCIHEAQTRATPASQFARAVPLDEAAEEGLAADEQAITACVRAPHAALIDAAIGALAGLHDQACACSDAACAERVTAAIDDWGHTYQAVTGTDNDDNTRISTLVGEIGECLGTARAAK